MVQNIHFWGVFSGIGAYLFGALSVWKFSPQSYTAAKIMLLILFFPPCRFANPAIVLPYLLLLKSYSKNTAHTNHCIIRMLHRLAFGLKMDALLFQLSVFHLFNKILNDPAAAAYGVQSFRALQYWIVQQQVGQRSQPNCLLFTGTGDLCQVCDKPLLCSGSYKQQGFCWAAVLEKCDSGSRDDWRLCQRRVSSFGVSSYCGV